MKDGERLARIFGIVSMIFIIMVSWIPGIALMYYTTTVTDQKLLTILIIVDGFRAAGMVASVVFLGLLFKGVLP